MNFTKYTMHPTTIHSMEVMASLIKDNIHSKRYFAIVDHFLKFPYTSGLIEKHHVLPKSIFGKNNFLVSVSPKCHFILHRLLVKMFIDNKNISKMKSAIVYFTANLDKTSRAYQIAREMASVNLSTRMKDIWASKEGYEKRCKLNKVINSNPIKRKKQSELMAGSGNSNAKLSTDDVISILELANKGYLASHISDILKIDAKNNFMVLEILQNNSWKNIDRGAYPIVSQFSGKGIRYTLNPEEIKEYSKFPDRLITEKGFSKYMVMTFKNKKHQYLQLLTNQGLI